MYSVYTILWNK